MTDGFSLTLPGDARFRGLAAELGARVIQRPFDGFRSQKQFAVEQAAHDWVLCLDADERISPELRASLVAARDGGFEGAAGYRFARLSEYFGKFLRHGNAYPDRVLRLFDRRRGGWRGKREVHEAASVDGPVRTLAGSGIGGARTMFAFQQKHSPLGRGVTLDELGGSALYLLSELSGGVTGGRAGRCTRA